MFPLGVDDKFFKALLNSSRENKWIDGNFDTGRRSAGDALPFNVDAVLTLLLSVVREMRLIGVNFGKGRRTTCSDIWVALPFEDLTENSVNEISDCNKDDQLIEGELFASAPLVELHQLELNGSNSS